MKFKSQRIKTNFRLYQEQKSKMESSIFDLIDGDKETKQTKGLAYLLKLDTNIIERILSLDVLAARVKKLLGSNVEKLKDVEFIQIDAEMLSQGAPPVRRDITLTFYSRNNDKLDNDKILVIIIEAKSVKLRNVGNIRTQLNKYFDSKHYPYDNNIPKIGISLTKYHQIFDDIGNNFVSITWSELIDIIRDEIKDNKKPILLKNILIEYYNFITGVDKNMNFYEKEVLSVSAGKTFNIIKKFNIHACPSSYSYKTPLFITFRNKGGGNMDTLYKINDILLLNPNDISYRELIQNSKLEYSKRLLDYIQERKNKWKFEKSEDYRFYILSETEQISLKHSPKPSTNNSGARYYSLAELLSGKLEVKVDSFENKI
nr:hypothetical protein [Clostridium chromiireducens]